MRYIVNVRVFARPSHRLPQVLRELGDPDPKGCHAGIQAPGGVSVDLAVLPVAHAVHRIGQVLARAEGAVRAVELHTGERLAMTLSRGEIVVEAVEGGVEASVVGGDARDVV